jgi:hypothetical protein
MVLVPVPFSRLPARHYAILDRSMSIRNVENGGESWPYVMPSIMYDVVRTHLYSFDRLLGISSENRFLPT